VRCSLEIEFGLGIGPDILKEHTYPSDTIVASNSLVNKNFSSIKPYGLLAGCPAVLKVTGVKRVYDREYEARLDKQYGYHRTFL
jgi:hypothetical protein